MFSGDTNSLENKFLLQGFLSGDKALANPAGWSCCCLDPVCLCDRTKATQNFLPHCLGCQVSTEALHFWSQATLQKNCRDKQFQNL